ncbi:MAG: hypothetical protein ACOYVK_07960 [Bacillota bacterium]
MDNKDYKKDPMKDYAMEDNYPMYGHMPMMDMMMPSMDYMGMPCPMYGMHHAMLPEMSHMPCPMMSHMPEMSHMPMGYMPEMSHMPMDYMPEMSHMPMGNMPMHTMPMENPVLGMMDTMKDKKDYCYMYHMHRYMAHMHEAEACRVKAQECMLEEKKKR